MIVKIKTPCSKADDLIMQDQCSFMTMILDYEIEEHILFKDEYIIISNEICSIFGIDEKYLYQLNFSTN